MRINRGSFFSALAGATIAIVVMAVLPAVAADDDPVLMGQKNTSKTVTRLNTKGGLRIDNFKIGNPALILNVADTSLPPMQVNANGRIDNLNADMVDGSQANELIRAAFVDTQDVNEGTVFSGGSAANVLTTSITAPKRGLLMITAGMNGNTGTWDTWLCILGVDGDYVDGTRRDIVNHDAGGDHTAANESDCATNGVIAVEPGVHSVWLSVQDWNFVNLQQGSLMVLYVPFDGTGAVPVPAP